MKERLLRLCLLAYPPGSRGEDGELLVQDALELSERDSSLGREVRGLVAGGIAARARGVGADLRGAPWGDALRLLALPLASVNLAVWLTGIAGEWEPLPLGRQWSIVLAGSIVALLGAALAIRSLDLLGAIPIALALLANGLGTYAGAGTHFSSSSVGALSLDVASAWIPAGLLLVAAAAALPARGPIRGRIVVARSAVGLLPGLLLLWVARSELAGGELEPLSDQLLFAGLAAAVAGAAIASIPLARRSPAFALAGALVLAAVAPEAVWLATGMELLLGYGALPGVAPLAVLVVGYPLAGLWVLALIRRAGQASATQLPRRA